ncbi:hypothetical protein [Paenibacillus silvestris]|uniref:hypothetical protein n=1 Tax=Paenibacillus silvestris TaxID=2606219 RepID=UPI0019260EEC|nr:hypothetical protein [Paenibacillus silvestris]
MNNEVISLINRLKNALHEDIIEKSYYVTEKLEMRKDGFDAIEPLLKLLEDNPDVDFGSPGPIVHFVEKYYKKGYEEKLIASLYRNPTNHTLWMLNRIINGSENEQKQQYLNVLNHIIERCSEDKKIDEQAKYYRSLHD